MQMKATYNKHAQELIDDCPMCVVQPRLWVAPPIHYHFDKNPAQHLSCLLQIACGSTMTCFQKVWFVQNTLPGTKAYKVRNNALN